MKTNLNPPQERMITCPDLEKKVRCGCGWCGTFGELLVFRNKDGEKSYWCPGRGCDRKYEPKLLTP